MNSLKINDVSRADYYRTLHILTCPYLYKLFLYDILLIDCILFYKYLTSLCLYQYVL